MAVFACGCDGQDARCQYHGGALPTAPAHVHVTLDRMNRTLCGEHATIPRVELLHQQEVRPCSQAGCEPCFVSQMQVAHTSCLYVPTPWFEETVARYAELSF